MTDSGSGSIVPSPLHAVPSAPASPPFEKPEIWDRLVSSKDDIEGFIAYGLYQQRKREWMSECEKRDNRRPADDKIVEYQFTQVPSIIATLRNEAAGMLYSFGDSYAESQMENLKAQAFDQRVSEEVGNLNKLVTDASTASLASVAELRSTLRRRTGYWHHVKTHLLGAGAIVGIIGFFALLAEFDMGPREIFQFIWKYLIH